MKVERIFACAALLLAGSAQADEPAVRPASEAPGSYLYMAGPSAHFAFPPDVGFDVALSRSLRAGTQLCLSMSGHGTAYSAAQVAAELFYYPGRGQGRGFELGLREYYVARLDSKSEGGTDFFNPFALGMIGMGFHTHATVGWMVSAPASPLSSDLSFGARVGAGFLVPTESGRRASFSARILEVHMGLGF